MVHRQMMMQLGGHFGAMGAGTSARMTLARNIRGWMCNIAAVTYGEILKVRLQANAQRAGGVPKTLWIQASGPARLGLPGTG
jgi:hypothetical protein